MGKNKVLIFVIGSGDDLISSKYNVHHSNGAYDV
jgi:hypothetical protein